MLNYNLFKGELDGRSLKDIRLNYEVNDIAIRKVILDRVLQDDGFDKFFAEYFNQNESVKTYFNVSLNKSDSTSENDGVCKKIEGLANYLLYCNEAKLQNRNSEHPYLTSYKTTSISKNETDFEFNSEADANAEKEGDVGNYKKVGKLSITKNDVDEIPTMKQLQDVIDLCKKKSDVYGDFIKQYDGIERLSNDTKSKLTFARSEKVKYERIASIMKDNQKFVKMMVKKPIYFKQPLRDTTEYDLSCIDLGNPHHIIALLDNYSRFKEGTYEDLNSDLRYVMMDLDNLIENTELQLHEKEILIMKIDGYTGEEILDTIFKKYGFEWDNNYLSKVYRDIIPKKISQQYKFEYEDWYYTEVEYGQYKCCSKCGEIKLVSRFGKDNRNKDGLQGICKKCDNLRKSTGK
jgi:hypothetical protein